MKKSRESARQLADYIELKLLSGEYQPGTALPSIRRMAAKFQTNYSNVYRTLQQLTDNGILLRDESGAFLAGRLPRTGQSASCRIALLLEGTPQGYGLIDHALLGIRDVLNCDAYEVVEHKIHPLNLSSVQLLELSRQYNGLLLLNSYDWYLSRFECACPAVGILMQNSYEGKLSTLNIDPVDAVRQAVSYFMEHAAHTVAIATVQQPVYRLRGQLFRLFWEEIGGESRFFDTLDMEQCRYEADTGYFFVSDTLLQSASEYYLKQHGVPLAAAHTVLGIDGKGVDHPDYHAFPSVGIDWRELGRLAATELLRKIADPLATGRTVTLPGKLYLPNPQKIT